MVERKAGCRLHLIPMVVGLFLCSGAAFGGDFPASTLHADIVTQYMSVAFGEQFPLVSSGRKEGLLAKRSNDTATHVFLLLADSLAGNEAAVVAARAALTGVLADLSAHAGGFSYDYRDETAMLAVEKQTPSETRRFLSDSMAVYVGTRNEIETYVARLKGGGTDYSATLELAERIADKNGLSVCFVASSYKAGGANEIGLTFVFAEQMFSGDTTARACFYETFMGAFGLRGRLPDGSGSVFSDNNPGNPTPSDWLLWRLHEDPALHFGMTTDQTRAVVTDILDQQ